MSGHTPGPWTVVRPVGYDVSEYSRAIKAGDDYICDVHHYSPDGQESAANARLIAAAPELVAALQALEYGISPDMGTRDCEVLRLIARSAIALVRP